MKNGEDSSSDSLVEIRLNKNIKKSELLDFDVESLSIYCSSCGHQINHLSPKEIKAHRKLGVIICKECHKFYRSSECSQNESVNNYCTWCGNGGILVVCDYCPNSFCHACIRRNFGNAEITVVTKENWRCYCCDTRRLTPKVNFCDFIRNYKGKNSNEKEKAQINENSFSEEWLKTAFINCDEACKAFHKKLSKLKSGACKSKSLKHTVVKLEELINSHKVDLKNIVVSLSKCFECHIKLQIQTEISKHMYRDERKKTIMDGDMCNNNRDMKKNLTLSKLKIRVNKFKKESMKAKHLLLNSSSESDHNSYSQPAERELSLTSSGTEQMQLSENNFSDNEKSIKNKNNAHTLKSINKKKLKFSNSKSKLENAVKNFDIESDPKLKLQTNVELVCCDHLVKDSETYIENRKESSYDSKTQPEFFTDCVNDYNRHTYVDDDTHSDLSDVKHKKKKTVENQNNVDRSDFTAKQKLSFSDSSDDIFPIDKAKQKLCLSNSSDNAFPIHKAKKKLGLYDSSDDVFPINKPNLLSIEKVSGQNSKKKNAVESFASETDSKLQLQTKVCLVPCDHLFKNSETCVKMNNESDHHREQQLHDEELDIITDKSFLSDVAEDISNTKKSAGAHVGEKKQSIHNQKVDLKNIGTSLSSYNASGNKSNFKTEQKHLKKDSSLKVVKNVESTSKKADVGLYGDDVSKNEEDVINNSSLSNSKIHDVDTSHREKTFISLTSSSESGQNHKAQAAAEEVSLSHFANLCNKQNSVGTSEYTDEQKFSFNVSDSTDCDLYIDEPDFLATEKVLEEKSGEEKNVVKTVIPETDPKLKLQVRICLVPCNHLLKNGETCVKICNESGHVEKEQPDKEYLGGNMSQCNEKINTADKSFHSNVSESSISNMKKSVEKQNNVETFKIKELINNQKSDKRNIEISSSADNASHNKSQLKTRRKRRKKNSSVDMVKKRDSVSKKTRCRL